MQNALRVEVHNEPHAIVISVGGELDLASSPALDDELERAARSVDAVVIVDLRELEFMDSTGLSVLVKAHQRASHSGQRLALVRGPQQVDRLLSLTGVAERFTVVDAPEDLLRQG